MAHRCCEPGCNFADAVFETVFVHSLNHMDLTDQRCADCSFVSASYSAWQAHLLDTNHWVEGDAELQAPYKGVVLDAAGLEAVAAANQEF